jgi:hypothetical protein
LGAGYRWSDAVGSVCRNASLSCASAAGGRPRLPVPDLPDFSMARRRFKDANNLDWEVYDLVEPAEPPRASQPQLALDSTHFPRYRAWLVFESANEHRRLTPIPEGWEDLPPAGLGLLLGRAVPFTR